MPELQVVENPRKRRRRRYTARQRAAGFGGKRRRRRRRNPALASLATNPRRRRRRSYARPMRRYRRRRNQFGPMRGWDFQGAFWMASGMWLTKAIPGFVQRWWPAMPTAGMAGYAVKAGIVAAAGWLVGMMPVRNKKQRQTQVVSGGLALLVYEIAMDFIPGMGGMGGFISTDEAAAAGLQGFIKAPTGLGQGAYPTNGGYQGYTGVGRYADASQEVLAA